MQTHQVSRIWRWDSTHAFSIIRISLNRQELHANTDIYADS